MADDWLRRLERESALGDPRAQRRFARIRQRFGLSGPLELGTRVTMFDHPGWTGDVVEIEDERVRVSWDRMEPGRPGNKTAGSGWLPRGMFGTADG